MPRREIQKDEEAASPANGGVEDRMTMGKGADQ